MRRSDDTTIAVFVDGAIWRRVDALDAAGPDENVYVVDAESGRVRFGDGRHGRIPPSGAAVQVEYRRGVGSRRPRYVTGQLLSAADLAAEQEYWLERHRRHNRVLHGWGIARGLEVSVADGAEINVTPGVALDPQGNELVVERELRVPAPTAPGEGRRHAAVLLAHVERPVDPVPISRDEGVECSGVAESVALRLGGGDEADGFAIARLVWEQGRWRVDPSFAPRPLGPA